MYSGKPLPKFKSYCGATVPRVSDKIRFSELSVFGYDRIFIQLGTNDIANLINTGGLNHVTMQEITRTFRSLRDVIRKRNSRALIILDCGKPRAELYSVSDGLHLNGAGVDRLEAAISQALSTGYLLESKPNIC